ncbi:MAG: hypothetical protein BWY63_00417 [Chloroflexi bacterium ADurb.Bin360]|nr:MAG: hypothetical protein BWY63_00417 [Chloroflexi bacterium ADurb.Bin360]
MLTRVENSVSHTQSWNQENRLPKATVNAVKTTFTHDGDGTPMMKPVSESCGYTTTYVGSHYEKTGSVVTKYCTFGNHRVAMRQGGVLTYLHGDHLGSASLATNASGAKVGEQRSPVFQAHLPYGGTRSGSMPMA